MRQLITVTALLCSTALWAAGNLYTARIDHMLKVIGDVEVGLKSGKMSLPGKNAFPDYQEYMAVKKKELQTIRKAMPANVDDLAAELDLTYLALNFVKRQAEIGGKDQTAIDAARIKAVLDLEKSMGATLGQLLLHANTDGKWLNKLSGAPVTENSSSIPKIDKIRFLTTPVDVTPAMKKLVHLTRDDEVDAYMKTIEYATLRDTEKDTRATRTRDDLWSTLRAMANKSGHAAK